MLAPMSPNPVSKVQSWVVPFFAGDRLRSEVLLHALAFRQPAIPLDQELATIQRSHGWKDQDAKDPQQQPLPGGFAELEALYLVAAQFPHALPELAANHPSYPDPLLAHGLSSVLPAAPDPEQRQKRFQCLGQRIAQLFPSRPDLILQLIDFEAAFAVLKSLPDRAVPASAYYGNTTCALMHLQALWAKGRYQELHLTYCHYLFQRRWFPSSDFLLRSYTILARIERSHQLFREIYSRHHHELQATTISNMLFTALGLEQLDHAHIADLVADFRRLTPQDAPGLRLAPAPKGQAMLVDEKPVLAITSADLRMHPVGRFWLPIARVLKQRFRLVHVALNPLDDDPIRQELKALSHSWHPLGADTELAPLLEQVQPQMLLDLGGHTADNRPGLLNHRFAPVQATYLGFYGPSYGSHCDWWILDPAVARRVKGSYPGSEPIWTLPGPSLCFDPASHGLPPTQELRYGEPLHPVLGSFNHTRKLTDRCLERFASVLKGMPEATLLFRSHSFYDHAVRRWFLQRFVDGGVRPEQLQPIPYAHSAAESLLDYGRIHLHLDSYPVCGTTTTLDAMAMGIPVLTCPNNLYAGAISAALIEQAGFADWICEQPSELLGKAQQLSSQYRSASSRRQLAEQVRRSPVCDTHAMPAMFAGQITEMLKAATLPSSSSGSMATF